MGGMGGMMGGMGGMGGMMDPMSQMNGMFGQGGDQKASSNAKFFQAEKGIQFNFHQYIHLIVFPNCIFISSYNNYRKFGVATILELF